MGAAGARRLKRAGSTRRSSPPFLTLTIQDGREIPEADPKEGGEYTSPQATFVSYVTGAGEPR